jgi:hypothetical protein
MTFYESTVAEHVIRVIAAAGTCLMTNKAIGPVIGRQWPRCVESR